MAHQLVYTSAARLLDAGRSGFGTVARSKTISPLLVSAIERVSQFSNIRGTDRSRVIFVHRRMVAGSNRYHILSRIADAGADYTGRTNHIAHHLIVTQEEMARAAAMGITPADVLTQFSWLSRWEGNVRFLTPEEDVNLAAFQPLGRQSARSGWAGMTGNPSHARLLAWDGAPRNGILLMPVHADPLALLAEALAEFGTQSWAKAFTTSLETTDELSELDWIIATPATFPEIQRRCGNRAILDLTQPQSLPVPPEPAPETRKIPAPDLTPRREPTTARNLPEPDIQTPRTGAVKVRVGSRAGEPHRQTLLKPAARPKQTLQIIAAAAVAVMALVILGIAVLKNSGPKPQGDMSTASAPALSGNQEKVLSDLKQAGIAEEDAKKIVTVAKDDSSAWVDYIKGVIKAVKDSNSTANPKLPDLPTDKEPAGSPVWLSSLVEVRKQWVDLLGQASGTPAFALKLDSIGKISKALTDYSVATKSDTGELQLTENDIGTFEITQIRREFVKLLGAEQTPLSQDAKDQLLSAIRSGNFDHLKSPKRYESLVEVIRERFLTLKSPELLAALKETVANPSPDDLKGLEQALNLWDKPEPATGNDIQKSRFVPDNYENLRQAYHESSSDSLTNNDTREVAKMTDSNGEPKPAKPGSDIQNQKQIIIVSEDELNKGVEVKLLKGMLESGIEAKNLINQGLTIYIDGNKYEKTLTLVNGEKYVSEEWNTKPTDPDLKIYNDGSVSMGSEKGSSIQFSYRSEDKTSHVLVDKKFNDPVMNQIKFSFKNIDENKVEIVGSARDWLTSIAEKERRELVCVLDNKNVVFLFDKKNFILSRPIIDKPILIFSDAAIKIIEKNRDAWLEKSAQKTKNIQSEIDKKEKEVADALESVKNILTNAIGEALILIDIKKKTKADITINDEPFLIKILSEKYNIVLGHRYLVDNEKDNEKRKDLFKKDLETIISKVGENKFNETLKKLVNKNWGESVTKNSGRLKIDKYIEKILRSTKKTEPRDPFYKVLESVSEITIQTSKGRVLFKATRQP